MGKRANEMRQLIEGMLDERTTEMKAAALKRALEHDAVDITLPGIRPQIGHQHLIKQIIEEAEDIFCGIGYTVESGPMVDTSYYNFTALNAPMDHPSRSARDTFYVVDNNPGSVAHPEAHAHGESDVLLRTQTSGVQIHTMESQKPPIYMICPGTVYRPDTADACHLPQFNQIEGLVVDEGITFGDLKGTLDYFVKCMFGEDRKTRYRPHFFPFTEPSCEVDVSCHVRRQGLQLLQAQRLDRDSGLRHGRPQRPDQLRHRSREVHRLRLWHWRRARRGPALRPAGPQNAYDGRYALLKSVLGPAAFPSTAPCLSIVGCVPKYAALLFQGNLRHLENPSPLQFLAQSRIYERRPVRCAFLTTGSRP